MKVVISPKRKDFFRLDRVWTTKSALIHYETQNFNAFTIIVISHFILIIAGLFNPHLLAIPITTFLILIIHYLRLSHISHLLEVKRKASTKGHENQQTTVVYEFRNYSLFKTSKISMVENFDGTSLKNQNQNLDLNLKSKRKRKINVNYPLDEGFGEKTFKEISIFVSDSLGLFAFKIIFDQKDKILIYPDIQKIREHKLLNNDDSYLSGDYEIFKKGISPNFYSIKQYQYGDPVKNINWKISQKINELVVNEYENAVNLKVHYILNFNKDAHMGYGVNSTWEYVRDVTLALLKNETNRSHYFDVYSNDMQTELSSGKGHFELIELKLCFMKPSEDKKNLIQKYLDEKYKGHALVYITPFVYCSSVMRELSLLKEYFASFSDVHIYLIDPFEAAYRIIMDNYKADLLRAKDESSKELSASLNELKNLGAQINKIKIKPMHKIDKQLKQWGSNVAK